MAPTPTTMASPADDPGAAARGWAYGIGAFGLTALGAFVVLGALGLSAQGDLEERCAPHCSIDEVRHMDRLYTAADVSLAIAVTALGSATVLFLTAPSPSDPSGIAVGPLLVIGGRFR